MFRAGAVHGRTFAPLLPPRAVAVLLRPASRGLSVIADARRRVLFPTRPLAVSLRPASRGFTNAEYGKEMPPEAKIVVISMVAIYVGSLSCSLALVFFIVFFFCLFICFLHLE